MYKCTFGEYTGLVSPKMVIDERVNFPSMCKITLLDGHVDFDIHLDPMYITWVVKVDDNVDVDVAELERFGNVSSIDGGFYLIEILTCELSDRYALGLPMLPLPGENPNDVARSLEQRGIRLLRFKSVK